MDRDLPPPVEHLRLRLRPLLRALREAVSRRQQANRRLRGPDAGTWLVTDDLVAALLDRADRLVRANGAAPAGHGLLAGEAEREEELRRRAAAGDPLPLDALRNHAGLSGFEIDALLVCAAPALESAFERLYGFVLDDLNRRLPCPELVLELTGPEPAREARLLALGPHGLLRRRRLLEAAAGDEAPTPLRQELRLGPYVLDFLLSGTGDPAGLFRDRAEVEVPETVVLPPALRREEVERVGRGLREGTVEIAGVWGPASSGRHEVALALCREAGRPVRRLVMGDIQCPDACPFEETRKAVRTCSLLGALLWIDADELTEATGHIADGVLREELSACRIPAIVTGTDPWRPTAVLAARAFADIRLPSPGFSDRRAMWSEALGELGGTPELAARYRLGASELRAVARVARTRAWLASNGHPSPPSEHLEGACATVTQRSSHAFATLVEPRRAASDLVLPPALHRQVLEIARFYRAWPRVSEDWGLGRLVAVGGIKALFTGDSGTGKTLAAEVIAGELEVPLIKVDVARVVSKWVGETEKNLSAVFNEAEESHAVLFFDEADALFGKRGEVERGTDRYANLEVSYLLQRLEEYGGLALLASNLKENIDGAFTRRFQVTLHFPRPGLDERRRIWSLALPSTAPLARDVDLETLARLDLTGGGIVGAARTAALLAADAGTEAIAMPHLVRAVARQFQREARLLNAADLGAHAPLLQER